MTIDQARRRQLVARWHRRFALIIAIWLVLLAATGILINHAHDWGLDRKPLPAFLQASVYGIEAGGRSFCGPGVDTAVDCDGVFGRLTGPGVQLLLGPGSLFLLDGDGQLIERFSAGQLGLGALVAGVATAEDFYLRDAKNTVRADWQMMDWEVLQAGQPESPGGLNWTVFEAAGDTISWERAMLDLHAARFLGPLARVFSDLMAGLVLLLAVTGAWLYLVKRKGNGYGRN